jgi:tetratricopeptide (TPR) repeat protein
VALRAGGALALFVLTFVYTPDLVPGNRGGNSELLREEKATQDLVRQLLALNQAQAAPGTEKRLSDAVGDIAKGAAGGDERLQKALDLLRAGKVADAVPLLQAVADEKTARIRQDSRVAAVAYRNLGAIAGLADPRKAREAYAEAARLDPNNVEGALWHGYFEADAGNLTEAETAYHRVISLGTPGKDDWALYWAHLGFGDVQLARGGLNTAMTEYELARSIADRVATSDPGNADWQRDLSVLFNKVGDVLVAQGNLPQALQSYRDGLAISDRLAKSDPGNAGWQRDLSVSFEKVGNVLVAQGDLPQALQSYHDSLAIIDRLAKSDPGNAGWQRDLSVSFDKVGDVLVAQGNLPQALQSFRDSLAIADRLAKSDPGNAGWQRDLSVSFDRVGDVLVAQGNLPKALQSFRDSLAISDRLAKADPGNADWQRDLSVSLNKVGDVLVAQGNLPQALNS